MNNLPKQSTHGWVNEYTFQDAKGEWLTISGQQKLFPGLPRKSVERWADKKDGVPCRFLFSPVGNRRYIQSKRVTRHSKKIRVFLREDLEQVHSKKQEQPHGDKINKGKRGRRWFAKEVHIDESGVRWLTAIQMEKTHGVGRNFCYQWSKRESRLRSGQKALRFKSEPNPIVQKGSPGTIKLYREEDALMILQGHENAYPGSGHSVQSEALREKRMASAQHAVKTILARGVELPPSTVIARAKSDFNVSTLYVRKAFKRLRGIQKRKVTRKGFAYLWRLPPSAMHDNAAPTNGVQSLVPQPSPIQGSEEKRGRGRRRDPQTEEVQKYCYDRYVKGDKLAAIRIGAETKFGEARAPKEDAHVRRNAQRYAEKQGLPLNRQ